MKITAITTKDGKLAAASLGYTNIAELHSHGGLRAAIYAGPGQQLHVLDVADDILQVGSPQEFHTRIESELHKARK
jgi:hypothetical protein